MIAPHQKTTLWLAYALHRTSGLALSVFLPAHFYVLSLALTTAGGLDDFLIWSDQPLVKFAEFGLIFLLAIHFFGGIRLMALEFLPWSPRQKTYAAVALAGSFFVSCTFLLSAV